MLSKSWKFSKNAVFHFLFRNYMWVFSENRWWIPETKNLVGNGKRNSYHNQGEEFIAYGEIHSEGENL